MVVDPNRFESSRVESNCVQAVVCGVVWCCVALLFLQRASRVLVWVRGKPWLEKCWCPFVIWPRFPVWYCCA